MKTPRSAQAGFVWLPVLLGILAVLVVSGGAYWYKQSQQATTPQPTDEGALAQLAAPDISKLQFTFGVDTFTLQGKDGYWLSEKFGDVTKGTNRAYSLLSTSANSKAEANGFIDAAQIYAVAITRHTGNNIFTPYLYAFAATDGVWQQVAYAQLPPDGGRTTVDVVVVTNSTIVLDVKTSGPDRNYHETYVPKRYVYALQNNQLVLQGSVSNDATVGWKTYTNTKYGFSLRYPQSLKIVNYPEAEISMGIAFQADDLSGFDATTSRIPNGQTLKQFLQISDEESKGAYEGTPSRGVVSSKEVSIGGLVGVQRKEIWYAAAFTTMVTYVVKDNILYTFRLSVSREGAYTDKDLETYNQILSTIKFTN